MLTSGLQHLSQELFDIRSVGSLLTDHKEWLRVTVAYGDEDGQRGHCLELRHRDVVSVSHPRFQLLAAAAL